MSDDTAIREMSGQIGQLGGTLTEFVKNQKDTNTLILGFIQKHEERDNVKHKELDADVASLKFSRKLQRALMASAAVGTPAAAVKLGFLGKIITAFAGQP